MYFPEFTILAYPGLLHLIIPTLYRAFWGAQPVFTIEHLTEQKFKILIVEDNTDMANICCRLLRSYGHNAVSVASVEDLIATVETSSFQILICDIGLAGMSGLAIPKLFPSIPAIAVTGYGTALDVKACEDAGFCEHVLKPFHIELLLSAIRRCADFKPFADAAPWAARP